MVAQACAVCAGIVVLGALAAAATLFGFGWIVVGLCLLSGRWWHPAAPRTTQSSAERVLPPRTAHAPGVAQARASTVVKRAHRERADGDR